MERTVLPRRNQLQREELEKLRQADSLCIALGTGADDPGYPSLVETIETLGKIACLDEGLFRLETSHPIDRVFARINERMIDPRMDSMAGLVIVDPLHRRAKWYLSLEASAVLNSYWSRQHNLFIGGAQSVRAAELLGTAAPIGASIWYVSSRHSPAQAMEIISQELDGPLTIFDAKGDIASSERSRLPADQAHVERCWQERALAEFLHA